MNADLRRETCQLCAAKLEAFYTFRPLTPKEERKYTGKINNIELSLSSSFLLTFR